MLQILCSDKKTYKTKTTLNYNAFFITQFVKKIIRKTRFVRKVLRRSAILENIFLFYYIYF